MNDEALQNDILVRIATPADAPGIAAVFLQAFEPYRALYTPAAFDATVHDPERIAARMLEGPVWVAFLGRRMVGTGSAIVTDKGCYVRGMGVIPDARGHDIGGRLLQAIETFARGRGLEQLYLSTTPFLDRAIRLYERRGFVRSDDGPDDLFDTPLFTMTKRVDDGTECGR